MLGGIWQKMEKEERMDEESKHRSWGGNLLLFQMVHPWRLERREKQRQAERRSPGGGADICAKIGNQADRKGEKRQFPTIGCLRYDLDPDTRAGGLPSKKGYRASKKGRLRLQEMKLS